MPQTNSNTTVSALAKGYRKQATKAYTAFKNSIEEFSWLRDLSELEITPSGREQLIMLDIAPGIGAHSVSDSGFEARTITPEMQEGSFDYIHHNARFFVSTKAKALDAKARANEVKQQIRYKSQKALEALARTVGRNFYGFSTGTIAKVANVVTAQTTATLTLIDAFGVSTLDEVTYFQTLLKAGEGVALHRSGTLVTNAIGIVTSVSAAGVAVIVFEGAVTTVANDELVIWNGVTDTTLAGGSDYNKGATGLLDIATSTTVHGLSSTTVAAWAAARNNSAGGRYGALKRKKQQLAIANASGGKANLVIMSQGVQNDIEALERVALQYHSSEMDLDASVSIKGMKIKTSPLVPPGCVFMADSSGLFKKTLTEQPDEDGTIDFGVMDKAEDRAGWKGGFDFIWAMGTTCRGKLALDSGLTEQ